MATCTQCSSQLAANDWFCNHCGQERPDCPECGAEMTEYKCKVCDLPRQAPCMECGLMISATKTTCPECGHDEAKNVKESSASARNKSLATVGIGVVILLVAHVIVPGPDVLGVLVGLLFAVPFLILGGVFTLLFGIGGAKTKDDDNYEEFSAADISKGVEKNKSKAWREKESREAQEAMQALGEVASSAADAYTERKQKKQKDKQLKEQQKMLEKKEREKQNIQNKAEKERKEKQKLKENPSLPSQCPRCGADWSGGLLSSPNVETYSNGRKASCTECTNTELLFRE